MFGAKRLMTLDGNTVPSAFNVEVAVEKLNRYKSPCSVHIPPEMIEA